MIAEKTVGPNAVKNADRSAVPSAPAIAGMANAALAAQANVEVHVETSALTDAGRIAVAPALKAYAIAAVIPTVDRSAVTAGQIARQNAAIPAEIEHRVAFLSLEVPQYQRRPFPGCSLSPS